MLGSVACLAINCSLAHRAFPISLRAESRDEGDLIVLVVITYSFTKGTAAAFTADVVGILAPINGLLALRAHLVSI